MPLPPRKSLTPGTGSGPPQRSPSFRWMMPLLLMGVLLLMLANSRMGIQRARMASAPAAWQPEQVDATVAGITVKGDGYEFELSASDTADATDAEALSTAAPVTLEPKIGGEATLGGLRAGLGMIAGVGLADYDLSKPPDVAGRAGLHVATRTRLDPAAPPRGTTTLFLVSPHANFFEFVACRIVDRQGMTATAAATRLGWEGRLLLVTYQGLVPADIAVLELAPKSPPTP